MPEGSMYASGGTPPPDGAPPRAPPPAPPVVPENCRACASPLPAGARLRCTACLVAWYCNRACQKAHWKKHKGTCHMMRKMMVDRNATTKEERLAVASWFIAEKAKMEAEMMGDDMTPKKQLLSFLADMLPAAGDKQGPMFVLPRDMVAKPLGEGEGKGFDAALCARVQARQAHEGRLRAECDKYRTMLATTEEILPPGCDYPAYKDHAADSCEQWLQCGKAALRDYGSGLTRSPASPAASLAAMAVLMCTEALERATGLSAAVLVTFAMRRALPDQNDGGDDVIRLILAFAGKSGAVRRGVWCGPRVDVARCLAARCEALLALQDVVKKSGFDIATNGVADDADGGLKGPVEFRGLGIDRWTDQLTGCVQTAAADAVRGCEVDGTAGVVECRRQLVRALGAFPGGGLKCFFEPMQKELQLYDTMQGAGEGMRDMLGGRRGVPQQWCSNAATFEVRTREREGAN